MEPKTWVVRLIEKEMTDFHIPGATDEADAMRRYRLPTLERGVI